MAWGSWYRTSVAVQYSKHMEVAEGAHGAGPVARADDGPTAPVMNPLLPA